MHLLHRLFDRYFIKQPRLRRVVTRLLYGSGDARVALAGAELVVNRALENGYARAAALCQNSSLLRDELPVLITLANLAGPGRTFVDVGANVGLFSVVFSRFTRIYPDFRVVSFEVDPRTFERLQVNALEHGFQAIRCALAAEAGARSFVRGAVSHVTTVQEKASSYNLPAETFDAEVRALDSFDLPGTLIVKIDVEGQELEVLRGARRLLASGRVAAVYLDGYGDPHCFELLRATGFELFDGRTLVAATTETFALLALRPRSA
jgi:FkbM family methyltransferase